MKNNSFLAIGLFLLVIFSSCQKDDNKTLPTLTTNEITNIEDTSAYSGGSIINDGNDYILERGVCWSSTVLEPVINGDKTNDGTGDGEYTSLIIGLIPRATYYVRAYATNSIGTAYGNTTLFKTNSSLPTVTTSQISSTTKNSALCGGNVTSEDNILIIARGVCWGTEPSPDLFSNKTNDGTGYGEFNSNITRLMANTTYFVRAYATNGDGLTVYGNEQTFSTLSGNIEYPVSGLHGLNVLDKNKTSYNQGILSLSAILPEATSLKVKIIGTNWAYSISQDFSSWSNSIWNDQENSRTFTSLKTGTLDFQLIFNTGSSSIIIYENNSIEPTWSKDITIN